MARQLIFTFDAPPLYAQEDFFISDANREAFGWINAWPRWSSHALLLTGPAGSGKTHLATMWRARADAILLPPERLGTASSEALMQGATAACIDSIDEVKDEAALFHLLNFVKEQQHSLLLVASPDPAAWPFMTPDLSSRLNALPAAQLTAPDDELLSALLAKQFADRQLQVPLPVLDFLATRMERSFSAVARLTVALDQAALTQGRAITLPLARHVLEAL